MSSLPSCNCQRAAGPAEAQHAAPLTIRQCGLADYEATWRQMIDFTAGRRADTPDELWICQHPPVYTLGLAGKPEHRLEDNGIALVRIDRGGQITYHGPGQVVVYLLLDLARRGLMVRELVRRIEQAVIDLLADQGVAALRLDGAPGVYVGQAGGLAKIAALGLRIRKNGCYHGVSLNVDMDLSPYAAINPCGYAGMAVTQTRALGIDWSPEQAAIALCGKLVGQLESGQ